MDSTRIYRMLAADRFDLLSDSEKRRLAEALQRNPGIDPADFADRLGEALGGADDPGRDRAFMDALEEAEAAETHVLPARGTGAVRSAWRMALAAAAGAVAVWLFTGLPDREPPAGRAGQPLFLSGDRSEGGAEADLDASTAPNITLIAEARIDVQRVTWQVLNGNLNVLMSGSIEFAEEKSALRTISVQIPKDRFTVETVYWFVLTDEKGETLRRWEFFLE